MGEIRTVSPCITHGQPYPGCKNISVSEGFPSGNHYSCSQQKSMKVYPLTIAMINIIMIKCS